MPPDEVMTVQRQQLIDRCTKELRPELFRDYGPNGLQVEGRDAIGSILTAVTASYEAIAAAKSAKVDALVVHHGIFWGKTETRLTGTLYKRVALLIANRINLFAWHLPLDAHPTLGNNAQLGRLLGITQTPQTKATDIVAYGHVNTAITCEQLLTRMQAALGPQATSYGACTHSIKKIAWCTGAGGDFLEEAAAYGIDAFITGEVSERHYHLAHELGVCLFTGGHHATERYGVQALGSYLANTMRIEHTFFDQPNPL